MCGAEGPQWRQLLPFSLPRAWRPLGAHLVLGTSGNPSVHLQAAQPFPQRHPCHLLTLELGWAQMSTAQAISGGDREPGHDQSWLPLGWAGLRRALTIPASSPVLVALPQFRLLPATAEHRLSNLPPAAPATQDSSHSRAIDQVTPPPQAAASQLVPHLLKQGLQVLQAPPRRPSPRPARACSLQGWRALALPGRSDPLGHLLFSLETKISWACPKLSQVCLLF